jgi:hypothetical protein
VRTFAISTSTDRPPIWPKPWPISPHTFGGADLLLAADCVAFAMADFNQTYLPGKRLVIACPKLDHEQEVYLDKMIALLDQAEIKSIAVMIMEVPCCGGLLRLAQTAVARARHKVPVQAIIVGLDGEVRRQVSG